MGTGPRCRRRHRLHGARADPGRHGRHSARVTPRGRRARRARARSVHCRRCRRPRHVWNIGPAPAKSSYLSIPAIIEAARLSGAQAIHPG
ncbi:biotin carboxylase N-terminal domain-containing protein, partial [Streptomyces pathocidini]|uniref:biotin carboxylase N-terminal domain-containing protein n=1 Tax=Streptomyces pathocidini TaxID=1650571 RepID=UPI003405F326